MSYWRPNKGFGPVQNDCFSICSTTKKPVLAHLWLNYVLDNTVGYSNFVNFNGYQPPLNEIVPSANSRPMSPVRKNPSGVIASAVWFALLPI